MSITQQYVFRDRASLCSPGWPQTHCVNQAGLESLWNPSGLTLVILLPQPPEGKNYKHIPLWLAPNQIFEVMYNEGSLAFI
jgi:hypothetical protein